MAYRYIKATRDGSACVITLNRPDKKNAISMEMMGEISRAAQDAEDQPEVRGIAITGGPSFFSSGADLNEAMRMKTIADMNLFLGSLHRLNRSLEELKKPVLAAIEGVCYTGGLEMAMACDLRVAGEGATFAITSARIGTVAGAGGTQRLPRLVGPAKAKELLFSAEPIDASEAHRIGLVNHVVSQGQALAKVKEMIAVYEKRGPVSLELAKRAVHQGMQMDLASAIELEKIIVTAVYGTQDKDEGIAAFLEKREARFKGR